MIHVSCGHERGIGLEIFLKSFTSLSSEEQGLFQLHIDRATLQTYLDLLKITYSISSSSLHYSNSKLMILFIKKTSLPLTTSSLRSTLNSIQNDDILLTLPTSKDQLIYDKKYSLGYTEYFRQHFHTPFIAMNFLSPQSSLLLISDHIPLKDVSSFLDEDLIYYKIFHSILGYDRYFRKPRTVLIAGINPHAGENGLLGDEEIEIIKAKKKLITNFPEINFVGPLPGDTLHLHEDDCSLSVYMYHDQGLSRFKAQNGFVGINLSFGLPFLRLSVDHGTAFSLYGRNEADLSGQNYLMLEVLRIHHMLE